MPCLGSDCAVPFWLILDGKYCQINWLWCCNDRLSWHRFTGLGQCFSSYRAAEHVRLTVCCETPNSRAASVAGTLSASLCVLFRFASRFFIICLPRLSKFVGARDEPAIREGLSLPLCHQSPSQLLILTVSFSAARTQDSSSVLWLCQPPSG